VAEVINRVEGVWYVASLTINGATTDVTLAGPGPLPKYGTVDQRNAGRAVVTQLRPGVEAR
jgi:hypothetical protein